MPDDEDLTCEVCGGPRPPGPTLCPHCEDLRDAGVTSLEAAPPRSHQARTPPHGNTSR